MGKRTLLPLRRIDSARRRSRTYRTRLRGLFKKCVELGTLCNCRLLISVVDESGKLSECHTTIADKDEYTKLCKSLRRFQHTSVSRAHVCGLSAFFFNDTIISFIALQYEKLWGKGVKDNQSLPTTTQHNKLRFPVQM